MLELPLGNDPRWFEVSAAACAASARSGVGLTHGIAHTLEPTLRSSSPGECWYHARLCCCFLWPVLQWSRQASGLWDGLVRRHHLDERRILDTVKLLHDPSDYAKLLPGLVAQWKAVLRDPCTRVHGVLVRANAIECFRR
jgi:alcohol dehydrogenase class IV